MPAIIDSPTTTKTVADIMENKSSPKHSKSKRHSKSTPNTHEKNKTHKSLPKIRIALSGSEWMAQTLPHSKKRSAVADYEDDNNNSPYREPANKRMCSTWIAAEESNESISIDSAHEDAMPRLSPLHSSCIEGSALRGVNNRHFYDEDSLPESPPDLTLMLEDSATRSNPSESAAEEPTESAAVGIHKEEEKHAKPAHSSRVDDCDRDVHHSVVPVSALDEPSNKFTQIGTCLVHYTPVPNASLTETYQSSEDYFDPNTTPPGESSENDGVIQNSTPEFLFDWDCINLALRSVVATAVPGSAGSASPSDPIDDKKLKTMQEYVARAVASLQSAYNAIIIDETATKQVLTRNGKCLEDLEKSLAKKEDALIVLRQGASEALGLYQNCQKERDGLDQQLTQTVVVLKGVQVELVKLRKELHKAKSDKSHEDLGRKESLAKANESIEQHRKLLADVKQRYIQSELSLGKAERKHSELHRQLAKVEEDFFAAASTFKQMKSDVERCRLRLDNLVTSRKERLAELLNGEEALAKIDFVNKMRAIFVEKQGLISEMEKE